MFCNDEHISVGIRCLFLLVGFTRASELRIGKGKVPRFFFYTHGQSGANSPQNIKTMKKLSLLLLTLTICFFTACHKDIWAELDELDQRVTKLEELCKEMNTNITSLQTIVSVVDANDYITGIVEIKKNGEVIGYTITFGKHDPITIYHGQDGNDGQNGADGKDGQDGVTPIIGIAQDTDGVYYWTLNGEWLLDDNDNKLPVSGTNGKDGQDGTDGKDGQDGADGKDGVTPQLKIEDGYWYISYDNGATWTQLGKATGENGQDGKDGADGEDGKDGQNGADGKDGQDGDSIFESVTEDDDYVYFTLSDGSVIKIPKGSDNQSSMGDGYVTSGKADGYYYVDLDLPSGTKWATCNIGSNRPEGSGYFFAWGETIRKDSYTESTYTLTISSLPDTIYHTEYDAATVNMGNKWATPTKEQWEELKSWASWTYTTYNDVNGWKVCGPNGNALFIPAVGFRTSTNELNGYLSYSSSTRTMTYIYCLSNYTRQDDIISPTITASPSVKYYYSSRSNYVGTYTSYFEYYYGYPIRPVLIENK